jgi:hypothetical protein
MYLYEEHDGKIIIVSSDEPMISDGAGWFYLLDFDAFDETVQNLDLEGKLVRTVSDLTSAESLFVVESRMLELCDKYQVPFTKAPISSFTPLNASQEMLFFNNDIYDELREAMFNLFRAWIIQTLMAVKDNNTAYLADTDEGLWFAGAWFFHKNSLLNWDKDINEIIELVIDAYQLEDEEND